MMNFRDWPEEEEQGEEGADDVAFQSGAVELSRPSPSTVEFSSASGRWLLQTESRTCVSHPTSQDVARPVRGAEGEHWWVNGGNQSVFLV